MNFIKTVIIFTAILTLALLYAPQPIAPNLAIYFNVSLSEISWVLSVSLIPLAIAPLLYGYLLEKFSLKRILIFSLLACAIFQIIANLSSNFYFFLSFRFLQSLCIPAILTSLLTLLTRIDEQNTQKNLAIYVGATTFGGFVGRVFGSYLSDLFSWHFALNFFAILMLFCAFLCFAFKDSNSSVMQVSLRDFVPYFRETKFLVLLFCVFIMFFSFQSVLSFLPFHLKDIFKDITQTQIGLIYLGFLTGIFSSLFIGQTVKFFKSRFNTVIFGLFIFITGTIFMLIPFFEFYFIAMFVFCSGMFICHCIFSALLNLSTTQKGLANGLYLTFYYSGGAFGSVLPSFYYASLGWNFLCIFTVLLLLSSILILLKYRNFYKY